jgi:hypothetical protein
MLLRGDRDIPVSSGTKKELKMARDKLKSGRLYIEISPRMSPALLIFFAISAGKA